MEGHNFVDTRNESITLNIYQKKANGHGHLRSPITKKAVTGITQSPQATARVLEKHAVTAASEWLRDLSFPTRSAADSKGSS